MGERDEESALPWDKIEPAKYDPLNFNYENIIANSKRRIELNANFKLIDENAKWIFERKDENDYSLNLDEFKVQNDIADAKIKKFKKITDFDNKLKFESLPNEVALFEKDTLLKQKRERWHEELQKDVYVDETLNIISEMKLAFKGKGLPQKISMN
jgi:carboxyl-terminal processing protease